jgi:amidohydrolase
MTIDYRAISQSAVSLRRAIHAEPELGFSEILTTQKVVSALESDGIPTHVRPDGAGLWVDLGTRGRRVAFRCDLDALPLTEATGLPFASTIDKTMHACGHDAHTAIGVGIARALNRTNFDGRIRIIFQPAEEIFPGGAVRMSAEGVLQDVESIIAYHVDPSIPTGTIGLKSGPITSSADRFLFTVTGPGGHTARPHETVDTIGAAARLASQLPDLLQRAIDPRVPFALVFGSINGGKAANVIPTSVTMRGTCRLLDHDTWLEIPKIIERIAREIVAPTNADIEILYETGIPPVVNDSRVATTVGAAITESIGHNVVRPAYQSMGADDFANYLEAVPGVLLRLGVGTGRPLHSATFDLDEDAIAIGIKAGVSALLGLLA